MRENRCIVGHVFDFIIAFKSYFVWQHAMNDDPTEMVFIRMKTERICPKSEWKSVKEHASHNRGYKSVNTASLFKGRCQSTSTK